MVPCAASASAVAADVVTAEYAIPMLTTCRAIAFSLSVVDITTKAPQKRHTAPSTTPPCALRKVKRNPN